MRHSDYRAQAHRSTGIIIALMLATMLGGVVWAVASVLVEMRAALAPVL